MFGTSCSKCCCGVGARSGGNEVFERTYTFPAEAFTIGFCGQAYSIPDRFQVWIVLPDETEQLVFDSGEQGQQGRRCKCIEKPYDAKIKVRVDGLVGGQGTVWNFDIDCDCNECKERQPCGGVDENGNPHEPCPEECECIDGTCKSPCSRDDDCGECELCEEGACEEDPECRQCNDDNPCPFPCECVEVSGQPTGTCDCPQRCDDERPCPPACECTKSSDEKAEEGESGYCICDECSEEDPCPDGQVCVNGKCREPCDENDPCPDGQVCVDGVCRDSCNEDDPCPEGQHCCDGVCQDEPCEECTGECGFVWDADFDNGPGIATGAFVAMEGDGCVGEGCPCGIGLAFFGQGVSVANDFLCCAEDCEPSDGFWGLWPPGVRPPLSPVDGTNGGPACDEWQTTWRLIYLRRTSSIVHADSCEVIDMVDGYTITAPCGVECPVFNGGAPP